MYNVFPVLAFVSAVTGAGSAQADWSGGKTDCASKEVQGTTTGIAKKQNLKSSAIDFALAAIQQEGVIGWQREYDIEAISMVSVNDASGASLCRANITATDNITKLKDLFEDSPHSPLDEAILGIKVGDRVTVPLGKIPVQYTVEVTSNNQLYVTLQRDENEVDGDEAGGINELFNGPYGLLSGRKFTVAPPTTPEEKQILEVKTMLENEFGFNKGTAYNLATIYVRMQTSRCAKYVGRVLQGSPQDSMVFVKFLRRKYDTSCSCVEKYVNYPKEQRDMAIINNIYLNEFDQKLAHNITNLYMKEPDSALVIAFNTLRDRKFTYNPLKDDRFCYPDNASQMDGTQSDRIDSGFNADGDESGDGFLLTLSQEKLGDRVEDAGDGHRPRSDH